MDYKITVLEENNKLEQRFVISDNRHPRFEDVYEAEWLINDTKIVDMWIEKSTNRVVEITGNKKKYSEALRIWDKVTSNALKKLQQIFPEDGLQPTDQSFLKKFVTVWGILTNTNKHNVDNVSNKEIFTIPIDEFIHRIKMVQKLTGRGHPKLIAMLLFYKEEKQQNN